MTESERLSPRFRNSIHQPFDSVILSIQMDWADDAEFAFNARNAR